MFPDSPDFSWDLRKSWILSRKGQGRLKRGQQMAMAVPTLGPQMPGAHQPLEHPKMPRACFRALSLLRSPGEVGPEWEKAGSVSREVTIPWTSILPVFFV